jgi:hypothetical protein
MTLYAWSENLPSLIHFNVFDAVTLCRNGKNFLRFFFAEDYSIFYSGLGTLHVLTCSVVYGTLNGILYYPACYIGHDIAILTLSDPSCYVRLDTVQHCKIQRVILVTKLSNTVWSCILCWSRFAYTTLHIPVCYVGHNTVYATLYVP